ncbi:MAG: phosphoribosylamine--glycine ligase [Spirochaetales bacterium]|nr:phosphoribosylamine--glycine ligase [Spirochaetales bacterium]
MKVLLLGSGGREHALYWKLKQSPRLSRIAVMPGNGGIPVADQIPAVSFENSDFRRLIESEGFDLIVSGPEQPLVEGWLDEVRDICPVFGPTRNAAALEGSKSFAKEFMQRQGIPTARSRSFADFASALLYVKECRPPYVIKADGLAAGKGVSICGTQEEAEQALSRTMQELAFGAAGSRVVIEDYLDGQEMSLFALSDGKNTMPFIALQDHKRAFDHDEGPNTGGMGAYQPVPFATDNVLKKVHDRILQPTIQGMAREGRPYRGLLYMGLMIVEDEPFVIEYNVRFGDPETQALLPVVAEDMLPLLYESAAGTLPGRPVQIKNQASLTVVLAAAGYPGEYSKNLELKNIDRMEGDIMFFHAGTVRSSEGYRSSGGRILNVTALGKDLAEARERAYAALGALDCPGTFYRQDIGSKGIVIRS